MPDVYHALFLRAVAGDKSALDTVTHCFKKDLCALAEWIVDPQYDDNVHVIYLRGLFFDRVLGDQERAKRLYLEVARQNHGHGMSALAQLYLSETPSERTQEAVKLLQAAVSLNNPFAMVQYATLLEGHFDHTVVNLYEMAAYQGHHVAKVRLANYYIKYAPQTLESIRHATALYRQAIHKGALVTDADLLGFNDYIDRAHAAIATIKTRRSNIHACLTHTSSRGDVLRDEDDYLENALQELSKVVEVTQQSYQALVLLRSPH